MPRKQAEISDKFEAVKDKTLRSPIDWEKLLDRYIEEVKKSQNYGMGAVKDFVKWLSKNQDVLVEFQDSSRQYVMDEAGDVSAVFDVGVCSTCIHSRIRRNVPEK